MFIVLWLNTKTVDMVPKSPHLTHELCPLFERGTILEFGGQVLPTEVCPPSLTFVYFALTQKQQTSLFLCV